MSFAFPDALALRMQLGGDYKSLILADGPVGYWRLGDSEGYAQAVLSDGATAYWRLEESSGLSAADSSGNAHALTLPGAGIAYSTAGALANGTLGYALGGAQGRASFTGIAMGATCSFEFWFRPVAGVTAYTCLFTPSAGGTGLYFNSSTMKLDLFYSAADHFNSTALTAGTLYHVVVSCVAGAVTFYINGVADGTAAAWPGVTVDSVFNTGGGGAALVATLVDEMTLYAAVALGAQQVTNHYALRTSTITTVAAATVADSSGNGHVGTVSGGVTFGQTAQQPDLNAAALFDGASCKIAVGAIPLTVSVSIEAWIKTTTAAERPIFSNRVAAPAGDVYFGVNAGKVMVFTDETGAFIQSVKTVNDGNWHHVVWTSDGTTTRIYIDGLIDKTAAQGRTAKTDASFLGADVPNVAERWPGTLDEVAVYNYVLTAAQALLHYLAGQWTDVTADLTDEDLVLGYGIQSSRPEDRVATTGTLTFGLRNDAANSGATLGWYSPYSAARRAGFDFRIRTQLAVTYLGVTYYWTGRLRVIDATPDSFGERVVHCVAVDWMDEAARANTQVALQTNTDGGAAFSALVACVSNVPAATSAQVGSDTYVYAFDNIWQSVKVLSAMADLARSELGYIYPRRDTAGAGEMIVFENRHYRSLSSTLRATLSQVFDDLKVTNAADDIINRVRVRVYPRATATNQVVAALSVSSTSPATIAPGETQTLWIDYTDPVQRSSQIGAKDQIAPVATTDYTLNASADGSGADLTAFLTVSVTNFGSSAKFTVKNTGTASGVITKLQQRGTAIYALNPVESESVTGTGETLATIDAPYQSDPTIAKLAADYVASLFSSPLANVQAVTFRANQSAALLTAALAGDISDTVQLQEDVTGLTTVQKFYINAVGLRFGLNGLIDCTWRLAPADSSSYWILGVAGVGELGTTTRLAF
jgi:hypothetical protein